MTVAAWTAAGCSTDAPVRGADTETDLSGDIAGGDAVDACRSAPTLSVTVDPVETVLPGEMASIAVRVEGGIGETAVRWQPIDGEAQGADAPTPQPVDVGRYEVRLDDAGVWGWTATVSDACGEVEVEVRARAALPRVGFLNLVPGPESFEFGGPSGPGRLELSFVELDEAGSAQAQSGTGLPYLAATQALSWPGRTARVAAYEVGGTTTLVSVERDDLTPGEDHLFVLYRGAEALELAVVREPTFFDVPAADATATVLVNLLSWPDALDLSDEGASLSDPVLPRATSPEFFLPLGDPSPGLDVAPADLSFELTTERVRAFPGSPEGGVDLELDELLDASDRLTLVAFSTPSGGLGLLGVGRTPTGGAFPMAFSALPSGVRTSQAGAFLAHTFDEPLRLRDDAGRAVGPFVGASAVSAEAAPLGKAATVADVVRLDGEVVVEALELDRRDGARSMVWAWPAGGAAVTATAVSESLEALDADPVFSVGVAGDAVAVGLGVYAMQPFTVPAGARSVRYTRDDAPLLLTVWRGDERWLLSAAPSQGRLTTEMMMMIGPGALGDATPIAVELSAEGGLTPTTATRVPVLWTPYYTLQAAPVPGSPPVRTAAPFPGWDRWVPYGPNEDGLSGLSYRELSLSGAAWFRLELTLDIAPGGAGCGDSLLLRRLSEGSAFTVPLDGPSCGRGVQTTVWVPAGKISLGVVSDRLGDSTDSRGGGPWEGWRIDAVWPSSEPSSETDVAD